MDGTTELVVIGCSWGGLAALGRLLTGLPSGFSLPVVVAQHRAPDSSDTLLVRSLSRTSALAVRGVEDKDPIESGAVHVAPPDYHLLVERGQLSLSLEARVRSARPSVDVLFESAAHSYGPGVAGVVLTGAGADGAEGAAEIERLGGRILVQDPELAERREMPAAAIAACEPAVVADVEGLAWALGRLEAA